MENINNTAIITLSSPDDGSNHFPCHVATTTAISDRLKEQFKGVIQSIEPTKESVIITMNVPPYHGMQLVISEIQNSFSHLNTDIEFKNSAKEQ